MKHENHKSNSSKEMSHKMPMMTMPPKKEMGEHMKMMASAGKSHNGKRK